MKRALFLGRFQPLHNGHLTAIKEIEKNNDEIVIGIGSAQYGFTKDNPFTAGERIEMINKTLKQILKKPFYLIPIEDIHCYPKYVSHVVSLIPKIDVVYTGNPIVKQLFQEANFQIKNITYKNNFSARDIRKNMANNKQWNHLIHQLTKIELKKINATKRLKQIFQEEKK